MKRCPRCRRELVIVIAPTRDWLRVEEHEREGGAVAIWPIAARGTVPARVECPACRADFNESGP